MEGTIAMINVSKGYGFLSIESRKEELFFHATECSNGDFKSFTKGDRVNFSSIGSTERGEVALGVVKATL